MSDIHFHDTANAVLNRGPRIASAVAHLAAEADAILVATTGDVAFSGLKSEYAVAEAFFATLKTSLATESANKPTHFAFVPGNHDCDFKRATRTRDLVVSSFSTSATGIDESIIATCTSIQSEYFDFVTRLTRRPSLSVSDQVFCAETVELANATICIQQLNTAFLSRLKETPHSLFFPVEVVPAKAPAADLVVAMFHHPFGWLAPDNARALRKALDGEADILLTGHEHDSATYIRSPATEKHELRVIEGEVLQESSGGKSEFCALLLDLEAHTERFFGFKWSSKANSYERHVAQPVRQYERRERRRSGSGFPISKSFHETLSDIGTPFSHPQGEVTFADLFVCPDLEVQSGDSAVRVATVVKSEKTLDTLAAAESAIVVGADQSGKSTLAKALWQRLYEDGLTPVLVPSESTIAKSRAVAALEEAFEEQYSASVEEFRNAPRSSKAAIIDDLGSLSAPLGEKIRALDEIRSVCGRVYVFANDLLVGQEATARDTRLQTEFKRFKILEFGHRLRGHLIERWCNPRGTIDSNDTDLASKVAEMERVVTNLVDKNLLPQLPLFILTILQTYEASQGSATASGAYGHIYQILINGMLSEEHHATPADTAATLLGYLAFAMFERDVPYLSAGDIREIADAYHSKYKFPIDIDGLTKHLQAKKILERHDDGYRFRHAHIFCFFVARHLSQHRPLPSQTTARLLDQIHVEQVANICIFYIFLTKDQRFIEAMLGQARGIYEKVAPCDLQADVAHLRQAEDPGLALESSNHPKNRIEFREQLDSQQRLASDAQGRIEVAKAETGVDDLDEFMKLNKAYKSMQILGQVLRDFPGSLDASLKLSISRECYSLGLRILSFLVGLLKKAQPELESGLADHLVKQDGISADAAITRAQNIFYQLNFGIAHHTIKRIADSVGSKYLDETYREVAGTDPSVAIKVVDAAIRLEFFRPTPVTKLVKLAEEVRVKSFGGQLLRRLVFEYLYLNPVDYRDRQRLSGEFSIDLGKAKKALSAGPSDKKK